MNGLMLLSPLTGRIVDSKAFYFPAKEVVKVSVLGVGPSDGGLRSKNGMVFLDFNESLEFRGLEILQFDLVNALEEGEQNTVTVQHGSLSLQEAIDEFPDPIYCKLALKPSLTCKVVFSREIPFVKVQIGRSLIVSLGREGQVFELRISDFSDPSEYARLFIPPGLNRP